MSESIEDLTAADPSLELEMIPLADIEYDPDNPNTLTGEMYDALVTDIRENGFTQPVLVWRRPEGGLRMIDGEHRSRALGDLGAKAVPAVVVDSRSEDEARVRLISMNRIKGDFVPIRLAHMLVDLSTRIGEKELRRRLAMDDAEFRDNVRLASFEDDLGERLREQGEREQREAPVSVSFLLSPRDAKVVSRVVDAANEKGDRGKTLVSICRDYERAARERA